MTSAIPAALSAYSAEYTDLGNLKSYDLSLLAKIPHPLSVLRDRLISWRPPSDRVLRETAVAKGYSLEPTGPGYYRHSRSDGKIIPCYRTGIGDQGRRVHAELLSALRDASIPYFTGGGSDDFLLAINIASRDTRVFVDLVKERFRNDIKVLVITDSAKVLRPGSLGKSHHSQKNLKLLCIERGMPETGAVAGSWIEINIWKLSPGYSSQRIMETGTYNPHMRRVRFETIEQFLSERTDVDELDRTLASSPKFPIDIVYTWVDDKDEEWRRERKHYSGRHTTDSDLSRSNLDERFTNRDELRYSLRSVELFAPFVRNIFLVTNGQVPSWLNTDHPKIRLVTHADIFRNREHLPTFNSSSIETQLHHIDGLSEHFLYFNDDFFLGDFCRPEDFFFANGMLKYFVTEQRAFEHDIDDTSEEYIAADGNAIALLKRKFGAFTRELMLHAPYPARKSVLEEMEREFRDEFDLCASRRFRSHDDLRPIAFMQYHYAFQTGQAAPATITNRYLALWKPSIDKLFSELLSNRRFRTFCINDVGIPPSRMEWTNRQMRKFLQSYFPFESSFEKRDVAVRVEEMELAD